MGLPSGSDISQYILTCRASMIHGLPINLQYIYKRVSSLVDTERASLLLSDAKSGHSLFAQQKNVLPHQKKRKKPFHWTTFIILSCCGKNVRKEIYSKLNCHGQRELSEITMSLILFPTFYPPPLSSLHALMCTYSKSSNLIYLPL